MLPQTLRGSCSIRPTCLAQPHITRCSRVDRSRAIVLARQYATDATKETDATAAPATAVEDVKEGDKSGDVDKAPQQQQAGQLKDWEVIRRVGSTGRHGTAENASTENSKHTKPAAARSGPSTPKARNPTKTSKTATPFSPTTSPIKPEPHVHIMKEALAVLKDFQRFPVKYSMNPTGQPLLEKEKEKEEGADGKKQSLRSQFQPMPRSGELKLDSRQNHVLQGTLAVLKSALEMQAEHIAQTKGSAQGKKANPKAQPPPKKAEAKKTAEKLPLRQILSESALGAKRREFSERGKQTTPPMADAINAKVKKLLSPSAQAAASRAVGAATGAKFSRPARRDDSLGLQRRPKSFFEDGGEEDEKHGTRVSKFRPDPASALVPIEAETPPVPMVSYGLDRVLFNEGVYALQDPRTKVWNFDPYLAQIMPVDEFDFDALKEYITSSKDTLLMGITRKHNKKYTGSTSSMTSTMAHFHYLLSAWRPINTGRLSKDFEIELENFAAIQRAPAATFLNYRDGTYAIDADKQWDSDTILSMLGKSMEKLLTVPKEEFEKYRRANSHQLTAEEKDQDESYHYTTYGDFMMRSQLDAYDPRLPGTGIFDLKTRAVVSIRMDAINYKKGMGYEIRQRLGQWESFEREYFDMMRAAFLKYSLQVRMGRMDGIFVAYHNTQRIFGFQYIPLEEMDASMHGTLDKTLGDAEFTASLKLWNEMLNKATDRFPDLSLRVHVETRPSDQVPLMYFFAEPVTDEEIKQIQEKKKEDVDKFREEVLRIPPTPEDVSKSAAEAEAAEEEAAVNEQDAEEKSLEETEEEDGEEVWEDIMEVVEKTMDNDAEGISAIREAIGEALEQSGLLRARTSEEAQGYIESLLKLIVDVDAEGAKKEGDETVLEPVEVETTTPEESKPSAAAAAPEPTSVESPPSKKSAFGFLSSLFGNSSSNSEEAPAAKPSQEPPQEPSPEKPASDSPAQVMESSVSTSSPGSTTSVNITAELDADRNIDSGTSAELVELIIKLTSYTGAKAPAIKDTSERPEDLAKLDLFRNILLDMMPTSETTAQATDASATKTKATAQKADAAPKPIFGMVLTIRNKLNGKFVDRVEDLKPDDKWEVEYKMEEITDQDKARALYAGVQTRRKAAFYKDPMGDRFDAFGGALKKYTALGRQFRHTEDKAAKKNPVWIMGKSDPEEFKTVFKGAGVNLDYVMPNVPSSGTHKAERNDSATVEVQQATESEPNGDESVSEATTTSSFREWREQSKSSES